MESPFRDPELKLIETFGWNGEQFVRLERHLGRLLKSAATLGIPAERARLLAALPPAPGPSPLRIRLTLDRLGAVQVTTAPLAPATTPWRLAIAPDRIDAADPRLAHKTTDRALYDRTRAALPADIDEVIFLNGADEVAEGTITNVFFDLGHGLSTPPLASGCLPGCLRAELIETGRATEARLTAGDLPRAQLWVGNSLRGLIAARLVG